MTPSIPFPLYLLPNPFRRRSSGTTTSPSLSSSPTSPSTSPSTSNPNTPPTPSYLSPTTTSHLRCHKCLTDLIPTSCIISKGFTGRHGRAYLVSPLVESCFLEPEMRGNIQRIMRDGEEWDGIEDDDLRDSQGSGSSRNSYSQTTTASTKTSRSKGNSSKSTSTTTRADIPNTLTHKPVPRQLVTGAHTVSDISCRTCGSVLGWKYVWAEEESQRYKVGKFILETRRVVRSVSWDQDFDHEEDEDDEIEGHGDGEQMVQMVAIESGNEVHELSSAKTGTEGRGNGAPFVKDWGFKQGRNKRTTGPTRKPIPREDPDGFDSQDEDECEELFLGIWDQENARRRRQRQRGTFEKM